MKALLQFAGDGRVVLAAGLLYLLGQIGMAWLVQDLGPELLRLQVTTSWEEYQTLQAGWSKVQWSQYHAHFKPDFVFPWFYGGFLFCWLIHLSRDRSTYWRLLWPLPWLASIADCIENSIHIYLLNDPSNPETWVAVSGSVSMFKWFSAIGLFVGLLLMTVVTRVRPVST